MRQSMLAAVAAAVSGYDNEGKISALPEKVGVPSTFEKQDAYKQVFNASQPASLTDVISTEWQSDASLRSEFGSLAAYSAWRMHEHGKQSGQTLSEVQSANPDVGAYISKLQSRGNSISQERIADIEKHATTWRGSADVRREFGSFEVFASFMRAKAGGGVRILGEQTSPTK